MLCRCCLCIITVAVIVSSKICASVANGIISTVFAQFQNTTAYFQIGLFLLADLTNTNKQKQKLQKMGLIYFCSIWLNTEKPRKLSIKKKLLCYAPKQLLINCALTTLFSPFYKHRNTNGIISQFVASSWSYLSAYQHSFVPPI